MARSKIISMTIRARAAMAIRPTLGELWLATRAIKDKAAATTLAKRNVLRRRLRRSSCSEGRVALLSAKIA